jgi:hypothetical protein
MLPARPTKVIRPTCRLPANWVSGPINALWPVPSSYGSRVSPAGPAVAPGGSPPLSLFPVPNGLFSADLPGAATCIFTELVVYSLVGWTVRGLTWRGRHRWDFAGQRVRTGREGQALFRLRRLRNR